ncbi:MAG: iron-containing alcohol dehydrogenase, partial [Bacillota bacterium]
MIYNFDYFFPTKVFFGKGQIAKISGEIPAGSKVLVIYGGGTVKRLGILDQVIEKLQGFETGVFGGIGPNPEYDKLMEAVTLIRKEKYNFLLALGGGS